MWPIKISSHAKLNLALRITGRRADGYHTLSSLFQEIDFGDEIHFSPALQYHLTCNLPGLPCDAANLCTRAYQAIRNLTSAQPDWHLHLVKRIPVGSGLGGGSSNAAAVLNFLCEKWSLKLDSDRKIEIARSIGSDVPFYLTGKTQMVTGTGDILQPVQMLKRYLFVLVLPPFSVSTAWAYRQFQLLDFKPPYRPDELLLADGLNYQALENQFEPIVFAVYPQLQALRDQLRETGALYAGMSGSGSALFGIFDDRELACSALNRFTDCRAVLTAPVTAPVAELDKIFDNT